MDNQKIAEFFDRLAASWDDHMVIDPEIINIIFDCAGVEAGKDVLDVACGTGVLFPFYEERGVSSITGIDISSKMCAIARTKGNVTVYEGDASAYPYPQKYDVILIYNAFPHIADRELFFRHMAETLKEKGTFTVAHGMSREALTKHHEGVSDELSSVLPDIEEMKKLFEPRFEVQSAISDDRMVCITGKKKSA